MKRYFKRIRPCPLLLSAVTLLTFGATGTWYTCRTMYPFPEGNLHDHRPARVFTDRHGNVIRAELGDDDTWQLPVALDQVSPHVVNATLAVEDHRFWRHRGIDWLAVLRSAALDLYYGRIVSGASTVTMQLARLAKPEPRSFPTKFRQALRAIDVEQQHSKPWIIENYLNFAPYGSNLIGIESASRYYFGKPARDLNLHESALLAGLPQRPATLRPDRHPKAAGRRQRHVLERMVACGHVPAAQAWELGPTRDGILGALACTPNRNSNNAPQQRRSKIGHPVTESHFCALATHATNSSTVRTTLDPIVQALARTAVTEQVVALAGVNDAAAVVIANGSGNVRALVGTVNFDDAEVGQVNAACARRSPGSALKPFIYLLAIEDGLIIPETTLDDRPLQLAGYRPGNFDHTHRTTVTAREALAQSLNTPAVRLLRQVAPQRLIQALATCGVRTLDRGADQYGLALALGGGEVTLLELTNAYAGLARGGHFTPPSFVEDTAEAESSGNTPFEPGSIALLTSMLSTYPLPGCPAIPAAWKTGTSNGYRDAWCIAFNTEYTVGVWLGNKNGRPSRSLVGASAAAPVVASILQGLYRQHRPPALPQQSGTTSVTICTRTGLKATPACAATSPAAAVPGIPLRVCPGTCRRQECVASRRKNQPGQLRVLSPEPGGYHAHSETVRLQFRAETTAKTAWFLDGRHIGTGNREIWWNVERGQHLVTCTALPSGATGRVEVAVR